MDPQELLFHQHQSPNVYFSFITPYNAFFNTTWLMPNNQTTQTGNKKKLKS